MQQAVQRLALWASTLLRYAKHQNHHSAVKAVGETGSNILEETG